VRAALALLVLVVATGCQKSEATDVEPAKTRPKIPRADAGTPPDAAVAARPADAGLTWRGDLCKDDAQCGWDDPCKARRCGRPSRQDVGCDKSFPPPGTCTCVEEQCTLRPKDPAYGASKASCAKDADCAVDVGTGTCHVGGQPAGWITAEGPICRCDQARATCRFEWSGPVACKSWRDCSWSDTPRLRPVPSSQVPRPFKRQVRPCKDGGMDSVCSPEKVCKIVRWKC
jgi:hypothetical protein